MAMRALRNVPSEQRAAAYELHAAGVRLVQEDHRIVGVTCDGIAVTEGLFEKLGRLADVNEVAFVGSRVDSGGLSQLGGLSELETIRFDGGLIDEKSMQGLAALPQLRALTLSNVVLTDKAVKGLGELRPLESLSLVSWSRATFKCKEFLPQIEALSSLRVLDLTGMSIDEPDLLEEFRLTRPEVEVKTGQ